MIHLLLLSACGPGFTLDNFDYEAEYSTHTPVVEDLLSPTLITTLNDEIYVYERSEDISILHQVSADGLQSSIEIPETTLSFYAAGENLLAATEDGVHDTLNDTLLHEAYETTHVFEINGALHWAVEHVAGTEIHNATESVLIEIYSLDDLHVHNDTIWGIDQRNSYLVSVDTSVPMAEWAGEIQVDFEDEARRMTINNDAFYVTTRSTRWPYGGWILKVEGTVGDMTTERLCDSPPEAEHILVHNEMVYWSSKQSITTVSTEGGTYEMLAPLTTVGGMLIHNGTLWWTDTKGGRVFNTPVE